ncbi:MAG: prepilin-type N-terminal cleavage/methylation domain-containing protein [Patescibacteria group bacterium]
MKAKGKRQKAKVAGGFTLVETLVGVFLFSMLALAIYQGYLAVLALSRSAQYKSLATLVANDQIEWIRNVEYEDVGILNGLPAGVIPREATKTVSNITFDLTTTIRNIDDPFDGTIGGSPNDLSPADNKLVEVEVGCSTCPNFSPVIITTTVAPKNLETTSGNGALFVQVLDASGLPITEAEVTVENASAIPPLTIQDETNNSGMLQLVDVPPGDLVYEVTATKDGYSVAQTYAIDPATNPNPIPPHATVVAGQVTQLSLAIDRVSEFEIGTKTSTCSAVPSVTFNLRGNKLIGTLPDIFKFSQNYTSDSGGKKTVGDLEWDTYNFTLTGGTYDLAGTIPLLPIALTPDTTQEVSLVLRAKDPKALMVTVKDAVTGLPLSDASVHLTGSGVDETEVTNRGFFRQTDWSGGEGQDVFTVNNRFFATDGNIDFDTQVGDLKLKNILGTYVVDGYLESSAFDTGGNQATYYNLSWSPGTQPVETGADSIKFQVAASSSPAGPWDYTGPDGTASTFYTASDTNISNVVYNQRYLRYKVFLSTTDPLFTPTISDVAITYGTECLPYGQVLFNNLTANSYNLDITKTGYQAYSDNAVSTAAEWQNWEASLQPN